MAQTTFDGPIISRAGMYCQGPANFVTLGTTATLTVAAHAGRTLLVPTTCAITLPTILAAADNAVAGPGADPSNPSMLGMTFTFIFTAASSGVTGQTITCGGSDIFTGQILVAGTTSMAFNSTAGTVITLNATTSGGAAAWSKLTLTPITLAKWHCSGSFVGSGSVVTPFS